MATPPYPQQQYFVSPKSDGGRQNTELVSLNLLKTLFATIYMGFKLFVTAYILRFLHLWWMVLMNFRLF